jgi:hypothetical protein
MKVGRTASTTRVGSMAKMIGTSQAALTPGTWQSNQFFILEAVQKACLPAGACEQHLQAHPSFHSVGLEPPITKNMTSSRFFCHETRSILMRASAFI